MKKLLLTKNTTMKRLLLLLMIVPMIGFGQNKIELREGEEIIKKGRANYQAKLFNQPGRAYITNQRFYFVTSKLATKRKVLSFELDEIKSIDKGKVSLKGGLAAAINTIKIVLNNEDKYVFTVSGRKKWIKEMTPLLK